MKLNYLLSLILFAFLFNSCDKKTKTKTQPKLEPKQNATSTFQNKAHKLVHDLTLKAGNYEAISKKKDVVYTYTYTTPDGKADVSTEKYIFDGESSLGTYNKHERTLPELVGEITQGYNGKEFWLKHNGKNIENSKMLDRVKFNRKTNFYWFTMLQKLLDPGLEYEYIKESIINNNTYDIVKVTFNSDEKKPTDIYQLYINRKTLLVDQFLFTVVDFNIVDKPMLMQMQYEEIDGILIPTKRQYKSSTWNADVSDSPWIKVNWSNIKFNTNLSKTEFNK